MQREEFLERVGTREEADTWERIPVSDENAVPEALQQLG